MYDDNQNSIEQPKSTMSYTHLKDKQQNHFETYNFNNKNFLGK